MKRRHFLQWTVVPTLFLLLIPFQNCAPVHETPLSMGSLQGTPAGALTDTFTSIRQNILDPKCVDCHRALGQVALDNYSDVLGTLFPGSPEASVLYTSVEDGTMPQGGPRLNTAELSAIYDWIARGAPND
ncbi:MAG: hypothetical protein AB7G93_17025 [Bdellovibrionales bacterium]